MDLPAKGLTWDWRSSTVRELSPRMEPFRPLHGSCLLAERAGTWEKDESARGFSALNCVHRFWRFPVACHALRFEDALLSFVSSYFVWRRVGRRVANQAKIGVLFIGANYRSPNYRGPSEPRDAEFRIRRDVPTAMQRRRMQFVTSNGPVSLRSLVYVHVCVY